MATQVKFYAVASLPSTPSAGGLYFVQNGELYRGTQRFGLGRVTVAESTAGVTGAARGDIVVTGSGAGWVFDGTNWQSIGGDVSSLQSMWRADISTWTSALAAGGEGSYITGITQAADGKVTANASNFADDVKTAIGDGSATSTANGVTVSVVTTSGSVTGVEVTASDLNVNSITASAGTFNGDVAISGDLTVSGSASFNATTVNADTLNVTGSAAIATLAVGSVPADFTVGGSTIPDFIDNAIGGLGASTVTASANGIEVGVTTQSGKVTGVSVSANAITAESGTFTNLTVTDTATFSATTVSADSLTIGGSTVEQLADKQIAAIASATQVSASNGITVGVTTSGGSVTAVSVDATAFGNAIHFRGVEASTGAVSDPVAGDIVVIGSPAGEGFVAGQEYIYDGTNWELIGDQNTYAVNAYSSTASVFTGVETVPAALNAAGAAIDALTAKTDAYVGGTSTSTVDGVTVSVAVDATTLAPSVDLGVVAASQMAFNAPGSATELATTAAVRDFYDNNLVWLGADGNPVDGGSTPTPTPSQKTSVTFANGTTQEFNWSGTLDSSTIENEFQGEEYEVLSNFMRDMRSIVVGTDITTVGDIPSAYNCGI